MSFIQPTQVSNARLEQLLATLQNEILKRYRPSVSLPVRVRSIYDRHVVEQAVDTLREAGWFVHVVRRQGSRWSGPVNNLTFHINDVIDPGPAPRVGEELDESVTEEIWV